MPVIEYATELDDTGLEWLRMRIETKDGRVMGFLVQYETTVTGERVPVVRYDTAHGFTHRDRLNRRGELVDKRRLGGDPPLNEALSTGVQDLRANWRRYRQDYFGDER